MVRKSTGTVRLAPARVRSGAPVRPLARRNGWCETHYIKLATHNPLGPVSTAACLHLNLSSPLVGVQEQPRKPGTTLLDVVPVQMDWADGYLLPPSRPGLGIEFDRQAARAHPFQMRELPHLRREVGSVTNW